MKITVNIIIGVIFLASESAADTIIDVPSYSRDAFGGWSDTDGDCQNTRHEVLIARSLLPVELRSDGCLVLYGSWLDPYSDQLQHQAYEVDVDHLVPLKFAWDHGAWDWTVFKLEQFANDPTNLIITQKSLNRAKGSQGPLDWLPPNAAYVCNYIDEFLAVLYSYSLVLREDETLEFDTIKATICND
jgi:hypothetical protein